ncbi:MAG: hypothetical protein H0W77_15445 [Acidobacteria bacterium]|nr:hypothetical protein [Acidobacteriota bacterium]
MNQLKAIEENAELVINGVGRMCGVQLDYDEKSVEWLDGYIKRNRKDFDEKTVEKMTNILGSFLGECIRRNFGGEWKISENGFGIIFDSKNAVYPFAKTEKHLRNGSEDSIVGLYKMIPVVFNK